MQLTMPKPERASGQVKFGFWIRPEIESYDVVIRVYHHKGL
jgi:hypothetical protein